LKERHVKAFNAYESAHNNGEGDFKVAALYAAYLVAKGQHEQTAVLAVHDLLDRLEYAAAKAWNWPGYRYSAGVDSMERQLCANTLDTFAALPTPSEASND
jgi:hypothetical protein